MTAFGDAHIFQRLRLIMFDCDGTLVDSQASIFTNMCTAWLSQNLPPPSRKAVKQVIGLGLAHAIAALLPPEQRDDAGLCTRLAEAFCGEAQKYSQIHACDPLYPGTTEMLTELAQTGLLLGIATGKGKQGLSDILQHHAIASYFVTLQTSDDAPSKPHPAMLERAITAVGVSAKECVMIGDTYYDMEMAGHAGMHGLGVGWGYHTPTALKQTGAILVLERFEDLLPALRDLDNQLRF